MNETLTEEIMKMANLRNKYLKSRSEEDWQSHAKQRYLCEPQFRKIKRSYHQTSNEKNVDNCKFQKTVKPMLSNNQSAVKNYIGRK